jgi:hypothetical protein
MPDVFGSGEAEEGTGAKENFIGKIVYSDPEETHPDVDEGGDWDRDFEQVAVIEPLTEYDNTQYIYGMDVRKSFGSKWMVFIGHVENIHGPLAELGIESLDDLADFLEEKVYEWRDLTFEEDETFTWEYAKGGEGYSANINGLFSDMENPPNSLLVPVRHVDDPEELAEYDETESAEVEEVDF